MIALRGGDEISDAALSTPIVHSADAVPVSISPEKAAADESVYIFPATLAQRRYWLLDKLQPGGVPALNLSVPIRLRGPVDHEKLTTALNQVVARHEALRTSFVFEEGALRQIITPSVTLDLPLQELPNRADAMREAIQVEGQKAFDLTKSPLLRARLMRSTENEHLLLLIVHHIVSDGWSNAILLRDLCACYTALVERRAPALPELTLQFADFAEWQQARLADNDFASQRDYWREKLAGDLPGLDLPYFRQALPPIDTGATRSRPLDPALAEAAKSFAAQEHASAFMIFCAVFQALLHRYTGQVDFLLTTPSANRERAQFDSLIGPFANPLILRADLKKDPSFRELLGRTRQTALEAFAQQDIPFESLLDEFQAARLQVNFHYDAGLQQPLELPAGLTSDSLPSASAGTVYELSVSVLNEVRGQRLEIEYNSALFDAETIERMLGHYETLLRSALGDPAQPISKLKLLTAAEEQPLTATTPSTSEPLHLRPVLAERVATKADAMLARHGRREFSCAELLVRLEQTPSSASDLARIATWLGQWRQRLELTSGTPSSTAASSAVTALREIAALTESDRIASCSTGAAAVEEIGAALLANAMLVYATSELIGDSVTAFAAWLETENISIAFLPAATWNRFSAALAGRKVRKPPRLRLVIVTEGDPSEGTFGRVTSIKEVTVVRRFVLEAAGGTISFDEKILPENAHKLHVQDPISGQPLPIGVAGELIVDQPTGELARALPNESLERLGLISEQIYQRGFRLDPRQTEMALLVRRGVRHALVRRVDSAYVAYLTSESGMLPDAGALRRHLREQRRPNLAMPDAFIPVREIPLRSDGTLNLAALPRAQDALSEEPQPVRPYLGLQLQLIAIWEEVLGVRGIGIRDDFFDLGGNSLLAMRMLQRAEVACGKTILPATLFRHPTIEHLAADIARGARDESPALLRVHDAGTRTPFFYLHGDLSGGGFYSLKLSRALGPEQPFYVLPPHDIRALSAAPSIEEMAAEHLRAIRAVRPHGPYVVGGFCLGGEVAYELAQQIKASGDEVEQLLIIDASPDPTLRRMRWLAEKVGWLLHWRDEEMVATFGRWAIWRARIAQRFAEKRPRRSVSHRVRAARGFFERVLRLTKFSQPISTDSLVQEPDLPSAFQWAAAGYRPKNYRGRVALLLSQDVLNNARNIVRRWQRLAPNVTVQPLRGSHLECITAHVDTLAEKIEHCLETSEREPQA